MSPKFIKLSRKLSPIHSSLRELSRQLSLTPDRTRTHISLSCSTDLTTTIDLAPVPSRPAPKAGAHAIVAPPRLTLVKDPVVAMYGYDLDDQIDQGVWYLPGEDPREPTPAFEIEGSFEADVEAMAECTYSLPAISAEVQFVRTDDSEPNLQLEFLLVDPLALIKLDLPTSLSRNLIYKTTCSEI